MTTTSALRVEYLDGHRWLITEPFEFWLIGSSCRYECVRVSAGEITDFASIPRVLKVLWPSPGGPWDLPAVAHDRLYAHPYLTDRAGVERRLERVDVDDLFSAAMKQQGVNGFVRRLMHRAVRAGGWLPWNRYRQREAEQLAIAQAAQWWIGDPWAAAT